jgi:hypothetical protein
MFSHLVGFFGISYFDQTRVSWFALLAMIMAATAPYVIKVPAKHFARAPMRNPKPVYASSFARLRSKDFPLRDRSHFKTRFS